MPAGPWWHAPDTLGAEATWDTAAFPGQCPYLLHPVCTRGGAEPAPSTQQVRCWESPQPPDPPGWAIPTHSHVLGWQRTQRQALSVGHPLLCWIEREEAPQGARGVLGVQAGKRGPTSHPTAAQGPGPFVPGVVPEHPHHREPVWQHRSRVLPQVLPVAGWTVPKWASGTPGVWVQPPPPGAMGLRIPQAGLDAAPLSRTGPPR